MFNDLIEELELRGFKVFAYADDLAITGISEQSLKEAINVCENWTLRNKMVINKSKSGILLHNRKNIQKMVMENLTI